MGLKVTLKGLVVSHYQSVKQFANRVGWSTKKTYSILNGTRLMTTSDMEQVAEAFGIEDMDDYYSVFFDEMTTQWSKKETQS